jgi:putative ABC transport system ATP-binding protein
MIDLTDIQKTYKMGSNEVHALDGVTMSIDEHEFVAIIGPSGSGKSTLMNIIGCLDVPDSGKYMLDGTDVGACSDKQLALVRNRKIGFIFQQFNLLPKLTAWENVELPLIYQGLGGHDRHERTTEALTAVGLADRMHHRPSELSGGQQQRVAIARALATHPAILLADEPTGNLDSKSGREILNLLKNLHKGGNTIVLITHDPGIAAEAARRISLSDGRIADDSGNGKQVATA